MQDDAHADILAAALSAYASSRDARDLEHLLAIAGPAAWTQAARHLGPGADAEDAVQEAFIAIARDARGYDGRIPAGAWVGRLVLVACRRIQRGGARRRRREAAAMIAPAPGDPVERPVVQAEAAAAVRAAVSRLPAKDQDIIALHYFAGLAQAAIARLLGLTENAVAVRLSRARDRLRADPALRPDHAAVVALLTMPVPPMPARVADGARAEARGGSAIHPLIPVRPGWLALGVVAAACVLAAALGGVGSSGSSSPAGSGDPGASAPEPPVTAWQDLPVTTAGPDTVDLIARLRATTGLPVMIAGGHVLTSWGSRGPIPPVPEAWRYRSTTVGAVIDAIAAAADMRVRVMPGPGPRGVVVLLAPGMARRDPPEDPPPTGGMGVESVRMDLAMIAARRDVDAATRAVARLGDPDPRVARAAHRAVDAIGWGPVLAVVPAAWEALPGAFAQAGPAGHQIVAGVAMLGDPRGLAWARTAVADRLSEHRRAWAVLDPAWTASQVAERCVADPSWIGPTDPALHLLPAPSFDQLMVRVSERPAALGAILDAIRHRSDRFRISATTATILTAAVEQAPVAGPGVPGDGRAARRVQIHLMGAPGAPGTLPSWVDVSAPGVWYVLATVPGPAVLDLLRTAWDQGGNAEVWVAAAWAAAGAGPGAADLLHRAWSAAGTGSAPPGTRLAVGMAVMDAWGRIGGDAGEQALGDGIRDDDARIREAAWRAIGFLDHPRIRRLVGRGADVRAAPGERLQVADLWVHSRSDEEIRAAADDRVRLEDPPYRWAIMMRCRDRDPRLLVDRLPAWIGDHDPSVRRDALAWVPEAPFPGVVAALQDRLAASSDEAERTGIRDALDRVLGRGQPDPASSPASRPPMPEPPAKPPSPPAGPDPGF